MHRPLATPDCTENAAEIGPPPKDVPSRRVRRRLRNTRAFAATGRRVPEPPATRADARAVWARGSRRAACQTVSTAAHQPPARAMSQGAALSAETQRVREHWPRAHGREGLEAARVR